LKSKKLGPYQIDPCADFIVNHPKNTAVPPRERIDPQNKPKSDRSPRIGRKTHAKIILERLSEQMVEDQTGEPKFSKVQKLCEENLCGKASAAEPIDKNSPGCDQAALEDPTAVDTLNVFQRYLGRVENFEAEFFASFAEDSDNNRVLPTSSPTEEDCLSSNIECLDEVEDCLSPDETVAEQENNLLNTEQNAEAEPSVFSCLGSMENEQLPVKQENLSDAGRMAEVEQVIDNQQAEGPEGFQKASQIVEQIAEFETNGTESEYVITVVPATHLSNVEETSAPITELPAEPEGKTEVGCPEAITCLSSIIESVSVNCERENHRLTLETARCKNSPLSNQNYPPAYERFLASIDSAANAARLARKLEQDQENLKCQRLIAALVILCGLAQDKSRQICWTMFLQIQFD